MKTIFKKSILTSLCAAALLLCSSQAWGMLLPIVSKICTASATNKLLKMSTEADEIFQTFATKCLTTMDQFKNDYPDRPHEKIENFIKKNNLITIRKAPMEEGVHALSTPCGIFIENIRNIENNDFRKNKEILTDQQKATICHEVAHCWLGHAQSNKTTEKKEFEAQTLMVRTLHAINETTAILDNLNQDLSFVEDSSNAAYLLGILNGISKINDSGFSNKVSAFLSKEIQGDTITGLGGSDITNPQGSASLTQKLYKDWKYVTTYEKAKTFTEQTLNISLHDPLEWVPAAINIIDYTVTTTLTLGATYGLYRLYKFFKK